MTYREDNSYATASMSVLINSKVIKLDYREIVLRSCEVILGHIVASVFSICA